MASGKWSESRYLLFLSLGMILLRLLFLQQYVERNPFYQHPVLDSALYLEWAEAILEGKEYFPEEYHHPPAYPYFLAGALAISGHNLYLILLIQNLMVTLQALLVFYCAKFLFDSKKAWLAYFLFSICGCVLFYSMKILSETLYTTALLLFFFCLLLYSKTRRLTLLFLSGSALGLAMETRGNAMLCAIPPILALMMWGMNGKHRLKTVLLFTAGIGTFVVPVLIRNFTVSSEWVPVASYGGENFYFANNEASTGSFSSARGIGTSLKSQIEDIRKEASRRAGHELSSHEAQRFWFSEGLRFIRTQPGRWMLLELKKIQRLFRWREASSIYFYDLETQHIQPLFSLLFVSYGILVSLFWIGLASSSSVRDQWLLLSLIAAQVLVLLMFWPELRFLIPVIPFLCIVASSLTDLRSHRLKNAGRIVLASSGLILWIVSNLVPVPGTGGREAWYANASSAYYSVSNYPKAIEMAQFSIQLNPDYADAWVNLGAAYHGTGNLQEARRAWEHALQIDPHQAVALHNLEEIGR